VAIIVARSLAKLNQVGIICKIGLHLFWRDCPLSITLWVVPR